MGSTPAAVMYDGCKDFMLKMLLVGLEVSVTDPRQCIELAYNHLPHTNLAQADVVRLYCDPEHAEVPMQGTPLGCPTHNICRWHSLRLSMNIITSRCIEPNAQNWSAIPRPQCSCKMRAFIPLPFVCIQTRVTKVCAIVRKHRSAFAGLCMGFHARDMQ